MVTYLGLIFFYFHLVFYDCGSLVVLLLQCGGLVLDDVNILASDAWHQVFSCQDTLRTYEQGEAVSFRGITKLILLFALSL